MLCRFSLHLISLSLCSTDPQKCTQCCCVSFCCGHKSPFRGFTWCRYQNLPGLPVLNKILRNFIARRASRLLKLCRTPANVNQTEEKSNISLEILLIFHLSFEPYSTGNLAANFSCALGVVNTLRPGQNDRHILTTFSNAFSWIKIYKFRLRCHWRLFLRFELTVFQHWFR